MPGCNVVSGVLGYGVCQQVGCVMCKEVKFRSLVRSLDCVMSQKTRFCQGSRL